MAFVDGVLSRSASVSCLRRRVVGPAPPCSRAAARDARDRAEAPDEIRMAF
jgi:hypothetical protein